MSTDVPTLVKLQDLERATASFDNDLVYISQFEANGYGDGKAVYRTTLVPPATHTTTGTIQPSATDFYFNQGVLRLANDVVRRNNPVTFTGSISFESPVNISGGLTVSGNNTASLVSDNIVVGDSIFTNLNITSSNFKLGVEPSLKRTRGDYIFDSGMSARPPRYEEMRFAQYNANNTGRVGFAIGGLAGSSSVIRSSCTLPSDNSMLILDAASFYLMERDGIGSTGTPRMTLGGGVMRFEVPEFHVRTYGSYNSDPSAISLVGYDLTFSPVGNITFTKPITGVTALGSDTYLTTVAASRQVADEVVLAKFNTLGSAAMKNTGTATGNVVVVGSDGYIPATVLPPYGYDNYIIDDPLQYESEETINTYLTTANVRRGDIVIIRGGVKQGAWRSLMDNPVNISSDFVDITSDIYTLPEATITTLGGVRAIDPGVPSYAFFGDAAFIQNNTEQPAFIKHAGAGGAGVVSIFGVDEPFDAYYAEIKSKLDGKIYVPAATNTTAGSVVLDTALADPVEGVHPTPIPNYVPTSTSVRGYVQNKLQSYVPPVATSSQTGAVKPGQHMAIDGTGALNVTPSTLGLAPATHSHTIAEVNGLNSALAGKANSSHTQSSDSILVDDDGVNITLTSVINDLDKALTVLDSNKASVNHEHQFTVDDVTGLRELLPPTPLPPNEYISLASLIDGSAIRPQDIFFDMSKCLVAHSFSCEVPTKRDAARKHYSNMDVAKFVVTTPDNNFNTGWKPFIDQDITVTMNGKVLADIKYIDGKITISGDKTNPNDHRPEVTFANEPLGVCLLKSSGDAGGYEVVLVGREQYGRQLKYIDYSNPNNWFSDNPTIETSATGCLLTEE